MTSGELDAKIDDLNQRIVGWFTKKDGAFWKESWALVKEIGGLFQEVRYPTGAEKNVAWQRFQSIVEKMKAERERHDAERQELAARSAVVKQEIISMGQRAWPWENGFAELIWFITGPGMAEKVVEGAFNVVERMLGIEDKRTALEKRRDELKDKERYLKEAWDYFTGQKERLTREHKNECFRALQGVQTELDKAWAQWKQQMDHVHGDQRQLRERREADFERRRAEKRALIRTAEGLDPTDRNDAERAKSLMGDWKAVGFAGKDYEDGMWDSFRSALDRFWERRKRGNSERFRAALDKLVERQKWLEESIEHDEVVLRDARDKRDSAWSDSFRDKMDDKISSLESKIDGKRDSLRDVERRIDELRDKI